MSHVPLYRLRPNSKASPYGDNIDREITSLRDKGMKDLADKLVEDGGITGAGDWELYKLGHEKRKQDEKKLTIDGLFGPNSRHALSSFKERNILFGNFETVDSLAAGIMFSDVAIGSNDDKGYSDLHYLYYLIEQEVGSGAWYGKSGAIANDGEVEIWDKITAERIQTLHPLIREHVRELIIGAQKEGINLRITSGLRTFEEQDELYRKGRDDAGKVVDKMEIVTNAEGGQSYHNYGLAFDVVEIKDGKALWTNDNWSKIGELGKKYGFEWGGDFKSINDKPHFQKTYGYSYKELFEIYSDDKLDENGYIKIE